MAINVAGTNAIGDYLVSEITNARTLFGLSTPANAAPVSPVPGGSGTAPAAALTPAQLRTQVLAQQVANTQTLFGIQSSTQSPNALPADPNQTPQQVALAAIESSSIASAFSNIATLFGLGGHTDTSA